MEGYAGASRLNPAGLQRFRSVWTAPVPRNTTHSHGARRATSPTCRLALAELLTLTARTVIYLAC